MKPLITNIQRFCLHDGPGIRTTVFFKGCTLHCPWCANPENIGYKEEFYYLREKCNKQCSFILECQALLKGNFDAMDVQNCNFGAIGKFGKYYSEDELYSALIKDAPFYKTDGGVTFSGGECLLFLPYYHSVIQRLKQQKIDTYVETALFVPLENVKWATQNIDMFYVDIKILDGQKCKDILRGQLEVYLRNLELLHKMVGQNRIVYRIPLVPKITATKENLDEICNLVKRFPSDRIEIFSVHNLAKKKYERLEKGYNDFPVLSEEQLSDIKDFFEKELGKKNIYINNI